MKDKSNKKDYILIFIAVLVLVYTFWYITTHSEPITISDLLVGMGGISTTFSIIAGVFFSRIDKRIERIEDKFDKMNEKVNKLFGSFEF